MTVDDRAGLAPAELAEIEAVVARHVTLAEVILWGLAHRPPLEIIDVVVQDEFTHDVVLPYRRGLHLVYDTT